MCVCYLISSQFTLKKINFFWYLLKDSKAFFDFFACMYVLIFFRVRTPWVKTQQSDYPLQVHFK